MKRFLNSRIGRLRLIGFLEGLSLLILVLVAVPLKYVFGSPELVKLLGPVHGIVFVLFVVNVIGTSVEYNWKFGDLTWKILIACMIPFGTFITDAKYLRRIHLLRDAD